MLRWVLVLDALITGIVYGVARRAAHNGSAFYYLQQFPGGMRAIGCAFLFVAFILAAAVHFPDLRIGTHLCGVFLYGLYGLGSAASYWHGGDPGAGPVHLICLACLHGAMAVDTARRKAD